MKNTDYFKNKKVTVVGLARSGLACANLLYDLGAKVCVSDNQDNKSTRLNLTRLKSREIKFELGKHSAEFIEGSGLVVVSPGVTDLSPAVILAKGQGIPVIGEIEFAWMLCPATVIAFTGSSGKTTVATLIGKVLEASGKKVFVCGNIGNPFSGEVDKMAEGDFVSLEVSSFQLEKIRDFKPGIAVILNLSRNHLDRHRDMREYLEAKKRIFMNQDKDDFLVLNRDDPVVASLGEKARPRVVFFRESEELNQNQAAVAAVATLLDIDKDLCLKVFREFKGLKHRLEYVAQIGQVKFINDSKATVAESTAWALKNISCPIILIAGGKDKGVDYGVILDSALKKVKEVILIGEAKQKIREAFRGRLSVDEADTLEAAVSKAFDKASPGDCVLLSPMCSSFDMFSSYEERGEAFKKAVFDLSSSRR